MTGKQSSYSNSKAYGNEHVIKIGYACISTDDQDLSHQFSGFQTTGCNIIIQDYWPSRTISLRPRLMAAISACDTGDFLVLWKLDGVNQSLITLGQLAKMAKELGINIEIITGKGTLVDTSTAKGWSLLDSFISMADFEDDLYDQDNLLARSF